MEFNERIRWCMPFGDGVHSARAMHVHCVFAQAPSPSGTSDAKLGTVIPFNECYSMVHDLGCCGAMCTCNTRAICESSDFGKF